MKIGTQNYYADITSRGVGIFIDGIKKKFYPWGSGEDSEAREKAEEALELAENAVQKTVDTTKYSTAQTAGYFLRAQQLDGIPNQYWSLLNSVSIIGLYLYGENGSTDQCSYFRTLNSVGADFRLQRDSKNYVSGNAKSDVSRFFACRNTTNYTALTTTDESSKVEVVRIGNGVSSNSIVLTTSVTDNFLEANYQTGAGATAIKTKLDFVTQTITLKKPNETEKTIDLWALAELLENREL